MIKFNKPFDDSKLSSIKNLVHFSANGPFSKKCEQWLIKEIKCKDALVTHSCTAALEMCALLLNIKNKDEIIMPSYTFVSTANAFVLRGGKPVFVDIDPDTCNIDPSKIEQAITKKTKAIVAVHYAGVGCEMDIILKIAKKYKLYVIEDAAQAILSTYKGKPLGSIGDLATFSFHETKNIHCGEGGALLINNLKFIKRAKVIRDKGTNRELFNQNMVKKYTWVDYGSNYGLSEINAAFLYSQLKQAKKITKKKINIFNNYHQQLDSLEIKKLIKRPTIPKYTKHNAHMYYLIVKNNQRNKLIEFLKQKNIDVVFHYVPLHGSPYGRLKTKVQSTMHNTNFISNNLLRLPMHIYLSRKDVKRCVNQIKSFFNKSKLS
tara:strand:+ start:500 stop:1627 length:1128 start_codon:yes stop_codon:yes gene_type:complete